MCVGYHVLMPRKSSLYINSRYVAAIVILGLSIGLYISTLSPTISVGDSPELISSAFTLGISHPPGYPLFSLLGKSITFYPFGDSAAYKVNILSALLGAISTFFLYLSAIEATRLLRQTSEAMLHDHLSAFICSLSLAVSPIFWSQAVIAEVYSLNAAFFTLLLWLSFRWAREVEGLRLTSYVSRLLYLIAFLWGLSLANHHTMIAFGPIFLFFAGIYSIGTVLAIAKEGQPQGLPLRLTSRVSLLTFFFILGLSVYLYLPIRSVQNPFMDWGDVERLSGFLDVILRKQFGLGSRAYSIDRALLQGGYYFGLLREQFAIPGLLLGIIGALLFAKRSFWPFLFTLALFLIHGILTVLILNPPPSDLFSMDVMVIPSFAVFALWIGMGILFAYSGVTSLFVRNLTNKRERVIYVSMTTLLLTIPVYVACANFHKNDESRNTFAHDYANDVIQSVAPNGVLFVEADLSLFPIWYLQYVEGKRREVAVLDVDMLMLPWFKAQLKEKYPTVEVKVPDVVTHAKGKGFKPLSIEAMVSYKVSQTEGMLDGLMRDHPVYISYDFGVPFKEFGERKDIWLVRNGITFMVSKDKAPDDTVRDYLGLKSILKEISSKDEEVLFIGRAYVPAMEKMASTEISSGRRYKATELMEGILTIDPYNTNSLNNLAYIYAEEGRNFSKAERMVKKALAINPGERARYLKTLGFIYLKKGEFKMAADTFRKVLEIEPGSSWTRLRLEEALSKDSHPAE